MFKPMLLIAFVSGATAFKVESAPAIKPSVVRKQSDAALGLRLRGGVDATQIAKNAVYFVSAFMFIPAGRDVVSPGAEIMPDDDKLIGKMFNDKTKEGYTFMWNQWGFNWIALSIAKIMAVKSGNADMIKFGLGVDICTLGLMLKGWMPEFKPFLAMFGLEALAFAKLVMG
jgi:hypothetical protein